MAGPDARPLPLTLDEITPSWLTAALRIKAPGVTVRDARIVDVNHGTCTKVRMDLDLDDAGRQAGIPGRIMLKGGFEPHSRDLWYILQSEAQSYRDVFPALKLPSPACYFADYAEDQRQGVVLMEDLVVRGVRFCSALAPESFEAVARRLGELARFHARTWDSPEFAPGGRWAWIRLAFPGGVGHFGQYLKPEPWRRFVEAPRGAAASVRFHDLGWMIDAFERISRQAARKPHAVLHGDTHLGNLYVDPDGTPGFFDSLPSRGPVMRDVAYHLAGALDTADRRRWEGALLQHYRDELIRRGATPPSFDEMLEDYGVYLAIGYLIFLINESHYQPEAINTAYVARYSAAMIDHDTIGLLQRID